MGLLDGSPDDWLDLLRNSAQNQNLNAGIGADTAGQAPFGWQAPAQPPSPGPGAPLSLAPPPATPDGPGLGDRLGAGFQSWVHTPVGNPMLGLANGLQGFSIGQRVDPNGTLPAPPVQPAESGGAPVVGSIQSGSPFKAGNVARRNIWPLR